VLHAGDILKVGRASALAYLALSGGFDVAPMLGSRSTYVRAGLGGVRGRDLAKGDLIACGMASGDLQKDFRQALVFGHAPGPLRVIAGPQDDHFDRDQQALFFGADYRVSPQMDRMGVRFEGPRLKHNARGAEILTDGVTPGAIQVPPDGAPIALSVDGQTTGGYPKIGVIISADLPRLGALRPGDVVRFAQVKLEEAAAARRERAQALEAWMSGIVEAYAPGALNEAMLYGGNLVSGVARGDEINEADLWERWRDAH
jgi:biotin-dependent carboxylase-like uncharacterized protein